MHDVYLYRITIPHDKLAAVTEALEKHGINLPPQKEIDESAKTSSLFVKRDYYDAKGNHRPYLNVVHLHPEPKHPETPTNVDPLNHDQLLDGLPDGALFRVHLVPTGNVAPGHMRWTKPHTYSLIDGTPEDSQTPR